jgi:hypothetical protein
MRCLPPTKCGCITSGSRRAPSTKSPAVGGRGPFATWSSSMPRGSDKGERRGGRQRATPNKRTVLADRISAVASANPTASCDEIVAILVKDQALPASSRLAVARKWLAAARSRSAKGRTEHLNDLGFQATERPAPRKSDCGVARTMPQSTIGASPKARTATNRVVLSVLFSIAQDTATTAAERRQAASELAQYFLPKNPTIRSRDVANSHQTCAVLLSIRI